MTNGTPRTINIVLGLWLFLSAFLWMHTPAQMTNTWLVGLLIVVFAIIGRSYPRTRYLNTAAAVWLFISCWALPIHRIGTFWNNLLVSITVFAISLVGTMPRERMVPPATPVTR